MTPGEGSPPRRMRGGAGGGSSQLPKRIRRNLVTFLLVSALFLRDTYAHSLELVCTWFSGAPRISPFPGGSFSGSHRRSLGLHLEPATRQGCHVPRSAP